jgi:hypothetical protein
MFKTPQGRRARLLAGAAGILLVGTLGAGVTMAMNGTAGSTAGSATAMTTSQAAGPASVFTAATTTTTPAATTPARRPTLRALVNVLVRRSFSGDVTFRTKTGFETLHYERGTVTAVGTSSLTVQTPDGVSTTFAVTSSTHIRYGGAAAQLSQLISGDRAVVFGASTTGSGGPFTASLVRAAPPVKPATPQGNPTSRTPGNS